jgi:hypothetical protein
VKTSSVPVILFSTAATIAMLGLLL